MKVIGILGSMGPAATVDLFDKMVRLVPARRDQDHPRIIIDCNAQIPSRVDFLAGAGPSPVPALAETARNLERSGADFIAIPCNTAHLFFAEIQAAVSIPVLHMMAETGRALAGAEPPVRQVGLLATTGTIVAGLYHRAMPDIELLVPEIPEQEQIMESLMEIKAGSLTRARSVIRRAARRLIARGAQAVIAGCTEVPLVLRQSDLAAPGAGRLVPYVDATLILAQCAVDRARDARDEAKGADRL